MSTLAEEIVTEVEKRSAYMEVLPGIRMVAVSLGYTLVELSCGTMGICATPRLSADAGFGFYPEAGTLGKLHILSLIGRVLSKNPLEQSVGIAATNALSQRIIQDKPERYHFSAVDWPSLLPQADVAPRIGIVGFSRFLIRNLLHHSYSLRVIAEDTGSDSGCHGQNYTVSNNPKDLKDVDILLITGALGILGNIDRMLEIAKSARFIGIIDPSAGWLPHPAFHRGIHVVTGIRITDISGARRTILEGGKEEQFMNCARKYTILPQTDSANRSY